MLRAKFKNGTADDDFRTLRLFGHKEDIALNEFLYRLGVSPSFSWQWSAVTDYSIETLTHSPKFVGLLTTLVLPIRRYYSHVRHMTALCHQQRCGLVQDLWTEE